MSILTTILIFILKVLVLIGIATSLFGLWISNKKRRKLDIPKDCPRSYQGVGDPVCWECPLRWETCPFLSGKEKK